MKQGLWLNSRFHVTKLREHVAQWFCCFEIMWCMLIYMNYCKSWFFEVELVFIRFIQVWVEIKYWFSVRRYCVYKVLMIVVWMSFWGRSCLYVNGRVYVIEGNSTWSESTWISSHAVCNYQLYNGILEIIKSWQTSDWHNEQLQRCPGTRTHNQQSHQPWPPVTHSSDWINAVSLMYACILHVFLCST